MRWCQRNQTFYWRASSEARKSLNSSQRSNFERPPPKRQVACRTQKNDAGRRMEGRRDERHERKNGKQDENQPIRVDKLGTTGTSINSDFYSAEISTSISHIQSDSGHRTPRRTRDFFGRDDEVALLGKLTKKSSSMCRSLDKMIVF